MHRWHLHDDGGHLREQRHGVDQHHGLDHAVPHGEGGCHSGSLRKPFDLSAFRVVLSRCRNTVSA